MSGDNAFGEIVSAHGALIQRIARSHESNPARAEELTQEIMLAVWQALPRFRGEASQRTFVARIAHNRAISHVAREVKAPRSTELSDAIPSMSASPEDQVRDADLRAKLETAVRELPVSLKVVVTLALEGFSPEDVAAVLGISVSSASVRLHRAKAALQEKLKERS